MNSMKRTVVQTLVGQGVVLFCSIFFVAFLAQYIPRVYAEEAEEGTVAVPAVEGSTSEVDSIVPIQSEQSNTEVATESSEVQADSPVEEPVVQITPDTSGVSQVEAIEIEEEIEISQEENQQEDFFEDVEDFFNFEEPIFEPFVSRYTPPTLSTRNFTKQLSISHSASHRCSAERFSINLSGKTNETTNIILNRSIEDDLLLEMGSLPKGIDIQFSSNQDYSYAPNPEENSVNISIVNEKQSQKGNFMVPIFLTKRGVQDSTSVCQINIINI